jgi:concanavalin A-like lectin/glucanase superfamily protein
MEVWVSIRSSASRLTVTGVLVAIAVLLLPGTAQAATTVALWNMGDTGSTMYDATQRGHTGTLHNVAVQQPGQSAGKAFRFSGSPSYVSVPASTDFNPGTGNFRIQLSVNFTARPSASVVDYDLLRRGLSTTAGGDYKVEILQSGKAYCEFRGSSGAGSVSGGPNLADGRWHTIGCARTSSSVVLTVDGSKYSVNRATGSITSSVTVYIGARDSGGGDQFTGFMDSVSVSKG